MKSIIRDTGIHQITLKEFYKKVENEEFNHHLKLLIEEKESKTQVFGEKLDRCITFLLFFV